MVLLATQINLEQSISSYHAGCIVKFAQPVTGDGHCIVDYYHRLESEFGVLPAA